MDRHKLIGLIAITIMVFALWGGLGVKPARAINFYESQITSNSATQENPDAYFNGLHGVIVWQDNRNGNWDIYMYNPWQGEIRVTTNPSNQTNPRVYNDTIVWQDDRNGNWDIYMYNISSKVETQLTNDIASQTNPDIDGNRIVWQDYRTGRWVIYMYDLTTKTESPVTSGLEPATNPAISGNRIAYEKTWGRYTGIWIGQTLTWDTVVHIECIDISTGQTFHVSNPTGSYTIWNQYTDGLVYSGPDGNYYNPAISADYVAYQGTWYGVRNVYWMDLATSTGALISQSGTNAAVYQNQPGVYYVVYMDSRNGNWDIYLYNTLFAGTTSTALFRVTDSAANQMNPVVMEGRIVSQDDRNGNWDIYETDVGYGAASSPGLAGAAGPGGNQSETLSHPLVPSDFTMLAAVAVIAVIIISITLATYYKKHKHVAKILGESAASNVS